MKGKGNAFAVTGTHALGVALQRALGNRFRHNDMIWQPLQFTSSFTRFPRLCLGSLSVLVSRASFTCHEIFCKCPAE